MKRAFVFLSALVGLGGAVYLAGSIKAQAPAAGGAPAAAAAPAGRPQVAVFNMAAVMRDYQKARYHVGTLAKKKADMSADLMKMRSEYIAKQQQMQVTPDQKLKESLAKEMLELTRKIEDRDREINKAMNDEASAAITAIYDEIKTVVDKTAEMNGYTMILAYPEAVTPEEMASPFVKEMKLKPSAAQPFYVAKHIDLTGVVVQTLNAWYKAPGPIPEMPTPATPANAGVQGAVPAGQPGR